MDGVPGPHPCDVVCDRLWGIVTRKRRDKGGEQDGTSWSALSFGYALLVAEDVENEEPGPIGFFCGVSKGVFQHVRVGDSGQVQV